LGEVKEFTEEVERTKKQFQSGMTDFKEGIS
jgi:hypothetical protein